MSRLKKEISLLMD